MGESIAERSTGETYSDEDARAAAVLLGSRQHGFMEAQVWHGRRMG